MLWLRFALYTFTTTNGHTLGKMPILSRREEKLSTELPGHVPAMPSLLMGIAH